MKDIYIIDPICRNNDHYFFNFSILNECKFYIEEKKIKFDFWCFNSNNRIIEVSNKIGINVYQGKEYKFYILHILISFIKIFYSRRLLKSHRVILLAIDNTLIPLLLVLNIILIPILFKKITLISHNNLNTIKTSLLKKYIMKCFLILYQPRVVLLSPSLADDFRRSTKYKKVFGFFHQNFFNLINEITQFNYSKQKKVFSESIINILVTSGHSKRIIDLINNNIEQIRKSTLSIECKINIKYISNTRLNVDNINNLYFERIERPNDMKTYYKLINDLDYVFFPKDDVANDRASGVLMDSLTVCTNFIAPNVGHFKDVNNKYSFGLLYNNYNDLITLIENNRELEKSKQIDEKKICDFYKDTNSKILADFIFKF